jgi:hypothetical protein
MRITTTPATPQEADAWLVESCGDFDESVHNPWA